MNGKDFIEAYNFLKKKRNEAAASRDYNANRLEELKADPKVEEGLRALYNEQAATWGQEASYIDFLLRLFREAEVTL